MHQDNPAGRLYEVLDRMIKLPKEGRSIETLAVFFELAPSREDLKGDNIYPIVPPLMYCLTEVLKLTDEAERQLHAIEDLSKELYLAPFPYIRQTVSGLLLNLYTGWSNYSDQFKKTDFRGLEFCSDALTRFSTEKPIDQAALKTFLEEVEAFSAEILASELHWEAKNFILDRLDEIRLAIRAYHIRGVEGLRECLGKTIGLIYVNTHLLQTPTDDGPKKTAREKFFGIVAQLSGLVEFGTKAYALGEKVSPLLGPLWNTITN